MRKTAPLPDTEILRDAFLYQPETGRLLLRRATPYREAGEEAGYITNNQYRQVFFKGRGRSVHRVIWAIVFGSCGSDIEIDHINGIRSDNRLANLRAVSSSENNRNRKLSSRNKSGVKGVFWVTKHRKWRAVVGHCGEYHILGYFTSIDDAALVVAEARARLHREFANSGFR